MDKFVGPSARGDSQKSRRISIRAGEVESWSGLVLEFLGRIRSGKEKRKKRGGRGGEVALNSIIERGEKKKVAR